MNSSLPTESPIAASGSCCALRVVLRLHRPSRLMEAAAGGRRGPRQPHPPNGGAPVDAQPTLEGLREDPLVRADGAHIRARLCGARWLPPHPPRPPPAVAPLRHRLSTLPSLPLQAGQVPEMSTAALRVLLQRGMSVQGDEARIQNISDGLGQGYLMAAGCSGAVFFGEGAGGRLAVAALARPACSNALRVVRLFSECLAALPAGVTELEESLAIKIFCGGAAEQEAAHE